MEFNLNFTYMWWPYFDYIVLYFNILLHSFNIEYLFFCPSM
jgi:hypothetical protein